MLPSALRIPGLNQLVPPRIAAEAYRVLNRRGITNLQHGFFVRGFADEHRLQGIDELSLCAGGTQVAELCDDEIREFKLSANDFSFLPVSAESISPPAGMTKGAFSLGILNREIAGPPLQMVLANASLLFILAGRAKHYRHGYELAEEVFASGEVLAKIGRLRSILSTGILAV